MLLRTGIVVAVLSVVSSHGRAEPFRLRGDALARAESPVGLLWFSARGEVERSLSAEAVIWAAAQDEEDSTGDALVIAIRYRDPDDRGEARLGRFLVTAGALRPVHVDGGWGLVRLPYRMRAEAFAGVPVRPEFGAEAYDWVAGARVSRALGEWGSTGIAYLQQREAGQLADEEVGADIGYAPLDWLDLAGKASFDLIQSGLSQVHLSAAAREKRWRVELFGLHRSPSRILPATSLFSVLGDVPSQRAGTAARWRAAPRLDLNCTAAVRRIDDDFGESLSARALLRLDDRGKGALSIGLRREGAPEGDWTGVRGTGRIPLPHQLLVAVEAELAIPDESRGRGEIWPWALAALRWQRSSWTAAVAVEGSSSPEYRRRVDAMLRLSRAWEVSQ